MKENSTHTHTQKKVLEQPENMVKMKNQVTGKRGQRWIFPYTRR